MKRINPIDRSSIKLYFTCKDLIRDNPTIENRKELQALIEALKPFIKGYSTINLIGDIIAIYKPNQNA